MEFFMIIFILPVNIKILLLEYFFDYFVLYVYQFLKMFSRIENGQLVIGIFVIILCFLLVILLLLVTNCKINKNDKLLKNKRFKIFFMH